MYDSSNPTIAAVAWPARDLEWPCGTSLEICGPGGCVEAMRVDACPGCGYNTIDLSEAGSAAVCGEVGNCEVTIRMRGRVE